jgi:Mg/Co/Ni transporter MgtE
MELRLRKSYADIEHSSVSISQVLEIQNKNAELEILVSNMKRLLDLSRHRERKIIKVLEEAGIDHHLDFSGDEDFEQHVSQVEPSFMRNVMDRSGWLIGLLIFQSASSFILRSNEELLQAHPSIIFFLTMLVGAGGNAGNQATVRAIRGIAVGSLKEDTFLKFIIKEVRTGFFLSLILGFFAFLRVTILSSSATLPEAIAISIALLTIVFTSVILGAILPIGFYKIGVDPAHGGTTIQVVMDILGVIITCAVSTKLLDGVLSQATKPTIP